MMHISIQPGAVHEAEEARESRAQGAREAGEDD
jgi:hypothetical protein